MPDIDAKKIEELRGAVGEGDGGAVYLFRRERQWSRPDPQAFLPRGGGRADRPRIRADGRCEQAQGRNRQVRPFRREAREGRGRAGYVVAH